MSQSRLGTRLSGQSILFGMVAIAFGVGCGSDGDSVGTTPDASTGDGGHAGTMDGTVGPTHHPDAAKDGAKKDGTNAIPDGATSLLCGTDAAPATLGPSCCTTGSAYCLPSYDVEPSQLANFATCGLSESGSGVCVPSKIVTAGSAYNPKQCTSNLGAGVCLSKCLGAVATNPAYALLTQTTCDSDELCAPCTDPLTQMPTGACSIVPQACNSDAGPIPTDASRSDAPGITCPYTGPPIIDPTTFPACDPSCGGAHCVPTADVPAAQQSLLASCMSGSSAGLCAPDSLIESAGQGVPPTCTSVAGAEGRCLSACIPQVASEADVLPQDVCASGTLCAPCYNPTAADPTMPTGACNIACDKPTKPPVMLTCPYTGPNVIDPTTFPACDPACAGAHCIPSALVPASQQSQLAACTGGFCTPDPIAASDDNYVPPSCTAFVDPASEGRCTSECLPSVEAQSSELSQTTCASGTLCAPCYDPFTGVSTGACNLACDKPKDAPFTFPPCCAYMGTNQGTCLPKTLIPSAEQGSLEANTCPAGSNPADYLCVPNEYLPSPPAGFTVQTCKTGLTGTDPGACVSNCANTSLAGIGATQGTCPANHICVSCAEAALGGVTPPGC